VLFTQLGFAGAGAVTKGRSPIRDFFDAVFTEFAKLGTSFEMRQQAVEGDYAYILWGAETADNIYEVGSDTFVVQAGQIVPNPLPERSSRNVTLEKKRFDPTPW
jgi:hypothetical protein